MPIIQLPLIIQNKICAGEVIISPYNVLKELVENSLDANAKNIRVKLNRDILNLEVHDDGTGIEPEDICKLCKPHHTSKYKDHITSFGFRGEALASIDIVSHLTIMTKTEKNLTGFKIFQNEFIEISMNTGTIIIVKNLFYNNKIREKHFFKNINVYKKMIELIFAFSIKNMNVKFFINDEVVNFNVNLNLNQKINVFDLKEYLEQVKQHFNYQNLNNQDDRINLISKLYKVSNLKQYSDEVIKIVFSSTNSNYKSFVFILFINNRLVTNRNLREHFVKYYKFILPKNRYPFVYLEINVPLINIDFNVHPTKKEVIIDYEEIILDILTLILDNGLNESMTILGDSSNKNSNFSNLQSNMLFKENSQTIYKEYDSLHSYFKSKHKIYKLLSINELKNQIIEVDKSFLTSLIYVGIVESSFILVQYNQYLMKCDLSIFKKVFLDHFFILNFGNFDSVNVEKSSKKTPLADMLYEYFSIKIEDDKITKIPVIYKYFTCNDWDKFKITQSSELEVFKEIIDILKFIYRNFEMDKNMFNYCKRNMKCTKELIESFIILKSLKELYRSFERC